MKIISLEIYRDGGTIEIKTDEGNYYIDGRINSNTKGKLFLGYPMIDNSNIILDLNDIIGRVITALRDFKTNCSIN